LAASSKMLSAARTRTEYGAAGSTMIFIRVEAAAPVACCSRAIAWPKACRRASRYAFCEHIDRPDLDLKGRRGDHAR
jgi:hypothetical protein